MVVNNKKKLPKQEKQSLVEYKKIIIQYGKTLHNNQATYNVFISIVCSNQHFSLARYI